METRRGRLIESVVIDLNDLDNNPLDICDELNEAKIKLLFIETMDQLASWISEWFGDFE